MFADLLQAHWTPFVRNLEFRTGYPVGRKEKLLPSPTRWDTFSARFCSSRRCAGKDLPRNARLARGNGRYHTEILRNGGQGSRR